MILSQMLMVLNCNGKREGASPCCFPSGRCAHRHKGLTLLQTCRPPRHSSNTPGLVLPQDLCTHFLLCLKLSSTSDLYLASSLTSFSQPPGLQLAPPQPTTDQFICLALIPSSQNL